MNLTKMDRTTAEEIKKGLEKRQFNATINRYNYVVVKNVTGGDYWKIFDFIRDETEYAFDELLLSPTTRNEITIQMVN